MSLRLPLVLLMCLSSILLMTTEVEAQASQTRSGTAQRADCGGPCMKVGAVRVATAPTIDGVLDEAMWQQIEPISDFRQREPVDGGTPSERTEVRIAYDEDHLYFGLKLFDSEPDKIIATILEREGKVPFDDRVAIGLDTFNDDRNGYMFGMNVFGTQEDGQFTDEEINHGEDWKWEGVYRSEGRVTEDGWELEVAIPFTTIRFPARDPLVMGIVLYRSIRRKNEEVLWPHIPQRFRAGFYQASQWADLEGLEGVHRGRNLEVKPFAIAGAQRFADQPEADVIRDLGVDVKYSLTSNLTLDLTWNTDFAQVEADNAQVNLTRFSLFFPEKREFFLERAGEFTFGEARSTEAFFSRRIGITNDILGGGRLTGQVGPFSIGVLNLHTRDDGDVQGANNGVARVRVDVLPRTTVGGIFTNLQNDAGHNRVAGGDLAIRFWNSSFLTAWGANVWDSDDLPGSSFAGSVDFALANDLWQVGAGYLDIGEGYRPELGLVRRGDQLRRKANAGFTPRFEGSSWARQIALTGEAMQIDGQDGDEQSAEIRVAARVTFRTTDNLTVNATRETEVLEETFFIRSGVGIPVDRYEFNRVGANLGTNPSRPFSGRLNVSTGNFYSGDRTEFGGSLQWTTGPHLTLIGTADRNEISLPLENGDFSTTVLGLTVKAAVNRKLFANALIQYDDVSETLQANVRVDWIHTPGSDLFLVLDTGYLTGDLLDPFETRWARRTGVVKLTYLKAF